MHLKTSIKHMIMQTPRASGFEMETRYVIASEGSLIHAATVEQNSIIQSVLGWPTALEAIKSTNGFHSSGRRGLYKITRDRFGNVSVKLIRKFEARFWHSITDAYETMCTLKS